jgi:hypothetical protein
VVTNSGPPESPSQESRPGAAAHTMLLMMGFGVCRVAYCALHTELLIVVTVVFSS